jgi:predicted glycogen debranching enzyme
VLTLQEQELDIPALAVSTENRPVDELLTKEWLLANGRGSYTSSTVIGCNTRGYHGLLIGSLNPPVNRFMALSNCLEMLVADGKTTYLSTFEFNGKFFPEGYKHIRTFHKDIGAHFHYQLDTLRLTRSIYLARRQDVVFVVYDFSNVRQEVEFLIRPLAGLRDFHSLQKSWANLLYEQDSGGMFIRHDDPESCRLYLNCPDAQFISDPQWWFNFVYRTDKERGQNFTEDLWSPGLFKCNITGTTQVIFMAELTDARMPPGQNSPARIKNSNAGVFLDKTLKELNNHRRQTLADSTVQTVLQDETQQRGFEQLCLAADDFVVQRGKNNAWVTILAGYPWFADWGRDAFISIPGLLLATGRFEEAKSVLSTFAAWADDGMIPSRFDDYNASADFNSVDASLWYINACYEYLKASGDMKGFSRHLLPSIIWIIESYCQGTKFDIHADDDALITAGNRQTQLTWMDARYDDVSFTPRHGKAVEVNALWYNCLCRTAEVCRLEDIKNGHNYSSMAKIVKDSFCRLFWNEKRNYLNDCINPDGNTDESLRPNQLYAVCLEHSPLTVQQQKAVVDTVQRYLLTPYGLRTLNQSNPNYIGKYTGSQRHRDRAYHQGTVWPYLLGAFIESYLKVHQFSPDSKKFTSSLLEPLMKHLKEDGCLGSISEIFDGDAPHLPRGCFAQAWSVAEILRVYLLVHNSQPSSE